MLLNYKNFKEMVIKEVDTQIRKIEENQDTVTQVRFVPQMGKFIVETGIKAEMVINGFLGNAKTLEEIECKRKGTKKYQNILDFLVEKYHPEYIKA